MSIEVACPACEKKLLAASKYLGRRIKCPHCLQSVQLPENGKTTKAVATIEPNDGNEDEPVPLATRWYVRTATDQRFGPTTKDEIDRWVADGRIDHQCQLRQEGWKGWRWADEIYTDLTPINDSPSANGDGQNPFDALQDSPNPFPQLEAKPKKEDVSTPPLRPDSFRLQLQMTADTLLPPK